MVKYTQIFRRQEPTNRLGVFEHFVGLVLKGLMILKEMNIQIIKLKHQTKKQSTFKYLKH